MYGVPNADGAIAVISASTTAALTVMLDAPQNIGSLLLGSGSRTTGYTLSGSGSNSLTFSNTSNSSPATILVIDGEQFIDAPVVLASNLVVTSTSSNPWTLSFDTASSITGSYSLTMSASDGTLILSGSDNYTGGTIVSVGTLEVTNPEAIQSGTSLMVGAEAESIFGVSVPQTTAAVPEPGTLALLGIGAVGMLAYKWRSRKRAT